MSGSSGWRPFAVQARVGSVLLLSLLLALHFSDGDPLAIHGPIFHTFRLPLHLLPFTIQFFSLLQMHSIRSSAVIDVMMIVILLPVRILP